LEGLATNDNVVVVAQNGDVRVTTGSVVVLANRGKVGSGGKVSSDGSLLVVRAAEEVGEASASSDNTAGVGGAGNFLLSALGTLGSTDSSDVGAGSGERGIESALGGIVSCLEVSNTIIARRGDDSNAPQTELADLQAESEDIRNLIFFGKRTIRDRVHKRGLGSLSEGNNPIEEWILGVGINGPVGGLSVLCDGEDVLDIQVGFTTVVGVGSALSRIVGANHMGNGGLFYVELALESAQIRGREILTQSLEDALSGILVSDRGSRNIVDGPDGARADGTRLRGAFISNDLGGRSGEIDSIVNKVNIGRHLFRQSDGMSSPDGVGSEGRGEGVELGRQKLFQFGGRGSEDHKFSVGSLLNLEVLALRFGFDPVQHRVKSGRIAEHLANLFKGEVFTEVGGFGGGNVHQERVASSEGIGSRSDGKYNGVKGFGFYGLSLDPGSLLSV